MYLSIHMLGLSVGPPVRRNPLLDRLQHRRREVATCQLHAFLRRRIQRVVQRSGNNAGSTGIIKDCQIVLLRFKQTGFLNQNLCEGAGDDFGVFVAAAYVLLLEEGGGPVIVAA